MPVLRNRAKSNLRDCNYQPESLPISKYTHSRRFTDNSKSTIVRSKPTESKATQPSDRILRRCSTTSKDTTSTIVTTLSDTVVSSPKPQVSQVPKHEALKAESGPHRIKQQSVCKKKRPSAGGGKLPSTADPYALDNSSDSGDEKENIDPNAAKQQSKVHRMQTGLKRIPQKLDYLHHPRHTPDGLRSPQPLTGRPTLAKPYSGFKPIPKTEFSHPNTPPVGVTSSWTSSRTLTEEARRKSATATIYLPLPRSTGTPAATVAISAPLASTPVIFSTGRPPMSPQITPLNPPRVVADVQVVPSPTETDLMVVDDHPAVELVPHVSTTVLSDNSVNTKDSQRSNETRPSGSSGTTGDSGGRRRQRMSESEKEEAYSSWLDEFNTQLEQFESHELTIDEQTD